MRSISRERALFKAKALCSRQEKCRADIRKKLKDWNARPQDIDDIINNLEKEGYIDENRYTRAFINDKIKFNKWGKIKIHQQLKYNNIAESIINKALDEIEDNFYIKIATHELEKKLKSFKAGTSAEKKAKLIRFGISRGFETDMLYSIIDSLLQE